MKLWSLPESLLSHTYQSSEKSPGCEKAVHYRYSSVPILESLFFHCPAFSCHTQGMDQTWGARRVGVHHQLCDIIGWTQPLTLERADTSVKVYFWHLDAELSEIQHFKYNTHIPNKLINRPVLGLYFHVPSQVKMSIFHLS